MNSLTLLSGDISTVFSADGDALLSGYVLAFLSWYQLTSLVVNGLALLSLDLSWNISALLLRDITAFVPWNLVALFLGNSLANVPGDALALLTWHNLAAAAGHTLAILSLDLTWNCSASLLWNILALLSWNCSALLSGHLSWHLLALFPWHILALLSGNIVTLLSGHRSAFLPWDLSASWGSSCTIVSASRGRASKSPTTSR